MHWLRLLRSCLLLLSRAIHRAPSYPKNLTRYANPLFWQYGLLAFVSGCCASNIELLKKETEAKVDPAKQENTKENPVDALTFMQTVVMSFARGMTHGDLSLPINDLFVYLPVQLIPALAQSILDHHFQPTDLKEGWGYRTAKGDAEDNPFLVAGAYRKEMIYNNEPPTPDTPWTERAYASRALDPSIGQSMSFPSSPQLKLRLEVPILARLGTPRRLLTLMTQMLTPVSQAQGNPRPGTPNQCQSAKLRSKHSRRQHRQMKRRRLQTPATLCRMDMGGLPFAGLG